MMSRQEDKQYLRGKKPSILSLRADGLRSFSRKEEEEKLITHYPEFKGAHFHSDEEEDERSRKETTG